MPKFFIEKENIQNGAISITGGDASHITRVLRMKTGREILLCDGCGTDFHAVITKIDRDSVTLSIKESRPCPAEPKLSVTLFQGLPKQGKMEYIIEKCTELGICKVVPVRTRRSVVTLKESKMAEKCRRWQKIAAESVKQCGRGIVPDVIPAVSLDDAVSLSEELDLVLAAYENEREHSLKTVLSGKRPKSAGIFIGPEGGFEPEEAALFQNAGIPTVSLGPRILRTETAGPAVLAALMYEFGELDSFF